MVARLDVSSTRMVSGLEECPVELPARYYKIRVGIVRRLHRAGLMSAISKSAQRRDRRNVIAAYEAMLS